MALKAINNLLKLEIVLSKRLKILAKIIGT
jgi:hypothetical protein